MRRKAAMAKLRAVKNLPTEQTHTGKFAGQRIASFSLGSLFMYYFDPQRGARSCQSQGATHTLIS